MFRLSLVARPAVRSAYFSARATPSLYSTPSQPTWVKPIPIPIQQVRSFSDEKPAKGIQKPVPISRELSLLLSAGMEDQMVIARTEVTREIWKYIRANNLQVRNICVLTDDQLHDDLT